MKVKDILKEFEKAGYKVSRQWFYLMGRKLGFITTVETTGDVVINEVKVKDFLEQLKNDKEEMKNYMSIKEASDKTNVPISFYYKYSVFGEEAGFKRFGYGVEKNKQLINIERFNEFIKERNFGYPKKWEKEYD